MVKKLRLCLPLTRLWTDRCTVFVKESFAASNGQTDFREVVLLEDVPCRISYGRLSAAVGSRSSASQRIKASLLNLGSTSVKGDVTLFLAPETIIPPGSKVAVTRQSRTTLYHLSGPAAVYTSHMEVPLSLEQAWA